MSKPLTNKGIDKMLKEKLDEILLGVARKRFKGACKKAGVKEFRCIGIDPSTVEGLIQLTAAVSSNKSTPMSIPLEQLEQELSEIGKEKLSVTVTTTDYDDLLVVDMSKETPKGPICIYAYK